MSRLIVTVLLYVLITFCSYGQNHSNWTNPTYKHFSSPGFVNITELNGGKGLGDIDVDNSKFYLGISNVFAYQINKNFLQGLGIGYFLYDSGSLIPLYLDIRSYKYLKKSTMFAYADGGLLIQIRDLNNGTQLFINPGLGINRSVSSLIDGTLSAGIMLQMGDNLPKTSFINFKLGIIYKKKSFRTSKLHSQRSCH